jgi:lipoate-protein ligase A
MKIERLDGPTNMRLDAELLASVSAAAPILSRVYGWDGPWVTLGMFQNPDRDLKPQCPVPWAMRPTGGRAVLHGHDVTLGLAMHLALVESISGVPIDKLRRSVRAAYRVAVQPVIHALRECGVPAMLGEERPEGLLAPRSADCFATISGNDVIDARTGKKVCGIAMRLTEEAVLVQASIPAGPALVDPGLIYEHPAPITWISLDAEQFGSALTESQRKLSLETSSL